MRLTSETAALSPADARRAVLAAGAAVAPADIHASFATFGLPTSGVVGDPVNASYARPQLIGHFESSYVTLATGAAGELRSDACSADGGRVATLTLTGSDPAHRGYMFDELVMQAYGLDPRDPNRAQLMGALYAANPDLLASRNDATTHTRQPSFTVHLPPSLNI